MMSRESSLVLDTRCSDPLPAVPNGAAPAACDGKIQRPLGTKCPASCEQTYVMKDPAKNFIECGQGNGWVNQAVCSEYHHQDGIFSIFLSQSDTEAGVPTSPGAPAPSPATTRASHPLARRPGGDSATTPVLMVEMIARATPWTPKLVLLLDAVSYKKRWF